MLSCKLHRGHVDEFLIEMEPMQEDDIMDDGASASAVRQRYERLFREKQRANGENVDADSQAQINQTPAVFHGAISTVFAKHLR